LKLKGRAAELCRKALIEGVFLSLTHDGDYSGAVVVLEGRDHSLQRTRKVKKGI